MPGGMISNPLLLKCPNIAEPAAVAVTVPGPKNAALIGL
jgi:hypothetical protein